MSDRNTSPFTTDVLGASPQAGANGYTEQPTSTRAASQPMTQQLLMIEDDTRLATMVIEYLRQSGYAVTHAADGAKGLEALQSCKPDLVILDLMLPDMDGLEVCRRIKGLGGEFS